VVTINRTKVSTPGFPDEDPTASAGQMTREAPKEPSPTYKIPAWEVTVISNPHSVKSSVFTFFTKPSIRMWTEGLNRESMTLSIEDDMGREEVFMWDQIVRFYTQEVVYGVRNGEWNGGRTIVPTKIPRDVISKAIVLADSEETGPLTGYDAYPNAALTLPPRG
jgi:hypothetical protein